MAQDKPSLIWNPWVVIGFCIIIRFPLCPPTPWQIRHQSPDCKILSTRYISTFTTLYNIHIGGWMVTRCIAIAILTGSSNGHNGQTWIRLSGSRARATVLPVSPIQLWRPSFPRTARHAVSEVPHWRTYWYWCHPLNSLSTRSIFNELLVINK